MSEQKRQILQMLSEGKISVDEAQRLMAALESQSEPPQAQAASGIPSGMKPKHLHIKVESNIPGDNVDIKIPIMLVKAGMKLGSLIPEKALSKVTSQLTGQGVDIDLSQILNAGKIEDLMAALGQSPLEIDADNEKISIYCSC